MDDFDGTILELETESDSLLSGNSHHDDEALNDAVRQKRYDHELSEIARLREKLKLPNLAGRELTGADRRRGNKILDARRKLADFMFYGEEIPEPEVTKLPATREQAKRRGLSHYYPDQPCGRGHSAPRFAASGNCVECTRLWHEENKEKVRKYSRESKRRAKQLTAAPV